MFVVEIISVSHPCLLFPLMQHSVQPDASKQIGTLSTIRKLQDDNIPLHIQMNNKKAKLAQKCLKVQSSAKIDT